MRQRRGARWDASPRRALDMDPEAVASSSGISKKQPMGERSSGTSLSNYSTGGATAMMMSTQARDELRQTGGRREPAPSRTPRPSHPAFRRSAIRSTDLAAAFARSTFTGASVFDSPAFTFCLMRFEASSR